MHPQSPIEALRGVAQANGWQGFLIPSADEYLSEFAQADQKRLRWATGFSGSTGLAAVTRDGASLFLDERYRRAWQARAQAAGLEAHPGDPASLIQWLAAHANRGDRIAFDGRLHAFAHAQSLMALAEAAGLQLIDAGTNPVDALWGEDRPSAIHSQIYDYPPEYAGLTAEEKIGDAQRRLRAAKAEWLLVCDPEDVAWLLNVRTRDCRRLDADGWHTVPIPLTRALVSAEGKVEWFVDQDRLENALTESLAAHVDVRLPDSFEARVKRCAAGATVLANLRRTSFRHARLVADVGVLRNDESLTQHRWRKHPAEIAGAREVHVRDSAAVIRFMAWLRNAVRDQIVTELDAAGKLEALRTEQIEYLGPSEPFVSASGPSAGDPHYLPSSATNRRLNEHPLYVMDSGGQYLGGTTDNTICLALGPPELRHVQAHTLVVKGWLALARARFPVGLSSSQLDSFARQHLWREGMDFGHGVGHGVGNFMNVHEGPYIMRDPNHPLVSALQAGMIITNEPGYYAADDFGIRVESHLLIRPSERPGFLEFETISHLPIDPLLIDPALLDDDEVEWLADYHTRISRTFSQGLDPCADTWLTEVVDWFQRLHAERCRQKHQVRIRL